MFRVMADTQLYRWLGLHGGLGFHPRSVYYDSVAPFSGRERSLWFSTTFQPNDQVRQELSFNRDAFSRLSDGSRVYTVNIINSRTTYQFNRRFSVRAISRYDSSRKCILADFLGAWELVPGTVAYVGYGELYDRRGWDGRDWLPGQGSYLGTRRGLFFKLSYLYRF